MSPDTRGKSQKYEDGLAEIIRDWLNDKTTSPEAMLEVAKLFKKISSKRAEFLAVEIAAGISVEEEGCRED